MKQFNVPSFYKSGLISAIKAQRKKEDKLKKDFEPTQLDFGPVQIFLARHFGFCYGVENAIEIAFKTIEENKGRNIFLLSEMIHNPHVNADLKASGVKFLQDTRGNQIIDFDLLQADDIVLIPAFGTTIQIENILRSKGIQIEHYNTTCPFVEKVWNRSEQISRKGFTVVIHGKPKHEETRATFSHASRNANAVVINDMKEAIHLAKYIKGELPAAQFYTDFDGRFSSGFSVEAHLQKIGVVNQTTQLATDTQAIADFLKKIMLEKYGAEAISEHFADTRDTLCYATNDNQTAVSAMVSTEADLALIIGGYNSSNTSHLVELCEAELQSYFIDDDEKMISKDEIIHCNWRTKETSVIKNWLPNKQPVKILVTSGASCPDAMVEKVIRRLLSFYPDAKSIETVSASFLNEAPESV